MPSSMPAKSTWVLCAAGLALHLYTAVFKASADAGASLFLVGLWLFSCAPYFIAAVLARRGRPVWGLGAAAASLAADVFMHYSVFSAPKGSTAALGLLFMPLWNLLVIGPAGALVFGLAFWAWGRRRQAD